MSMYVTCLGSEHFSDGFICFEKCWDCRTTLEVLEQKVDDKMWTALDIVSFDEEETYLGTEIIGVDRGDDSSGGFIFLKAHCLFGHSRG